MELFTIGIIWIITILVSFGMELHLVISMLKDMANNGYKLNLENVKEMNSQLDSSITQMSKVMLLTPFLNLFMELKRTSLYIRERENLITFLRTTDVLENMSLEEINEYNKRPTGLQALKMYLDDIPKINFIKLEDGSKIYFYYPNEDEKSLENIIITRAEGPAENLSKYEQKQEIIKTMNAKVDKILDKYSKQESEYTKVEQEQFQSNISDNSYEEILENDIENEKGKQKTLTKNNKNKF